MFTKLRRELGRARPPHGVDVLELHPEVAQELPDLVLAHLVRCSPRLQLPALLLLLCFPGLPLVGHLHQKLLSVLLG